MSFTMSEGSRKNARQRRSRSIESRTGCKKPPRARSRSQRAPRARGISARPPDASSCTVGGSGSCVVRLVTIDGRTVAVPDDDARTSRPSAGESDSGESVIAGPIISASQPTTITLPVSNSMVRLTKSILGSTTAPGNPAGTEQNQKPAPQRSQSSPRGPRSVLCARRS